MAAIAVVAAFLVTGGIETALPGSVISVASAHDVVLSSTPADGATVTSFPRTITLEFSAIPKDKFNTFAISNAETGEILYTATPDRDKQMMSITLPDTLHPGDGSYILGYQITSSDGHATRGKLGFTVESSAQSSHGVQATSEASAPPGVSASAPATGADEQGQQAAEPEESGSLSTIIFGGVGFALIGAIGVAWLTSRRRR